MGLWQVQIFFSVENVKISGLFEGWILKLFQEFLKTIKKAFKLIISWMSFESE